MDGGMSKRQLWEITMKWHHPSTLGYSRPAQQPIPLAGIFPYFAQSARNILFSDFANINLDTFHLSMRWVTSLGPLSAMIPGYPFTRTRTLSKAFQRMLVLLRRMDRYPSNVQL
jgi:hypothetical protein